MQINRIEQLRRAGALLQQGSLHDARAIAEDLIRRDKNDYHALQLLTEAASRAADISAAIGFAERLVRIKPSDRDASLRLASYLNIAGRHKEAVNALKKYLKLQPQDVEAMGSLAYAYEMLGDLDAALGVVQPHLAKGTETPDMAYVYASIQSQRKAHQEALSALQRHLRSPALQPGLRESYLYLLGRIYENLGEIDHAFEAYSQANALAGSPFDLQKRLSWLEEMKQIFTLESFKRLPRAKNQSQLPVFILCWPRSGSTLVERIIAAHPRVHAGGERQEGSRLRAELPMRVGSTLPFPQCIRDLDQDDVDTISREFLEGLRKLAPKAQRITDKATNLWDLTGLLALLFPKAAFIDLRRDPVDNCLACWSSAIVGNNPFNCDLKTIGIVRRSYEEIMEHWHRVLDVPILRVNYEDIVADQETWSRKIIEFCGLEWDDRVLAFHDGTKKPSNAGVTLSYQQVRQPIYKSSVGRAAKFANHLGPLYEGLGIEVAEGPQDLFLHAAQLERRNDLAAAEEAVDRGLAMSPSHAGLRIVRARILRRKNLLQEARELLQQVLKEKLSHSDEADAWNELAQVLDRMREFDGAFEAFGRAKSAQAATLTAAMLPRADWTSRIAEFERGFSVQRISEWGARQFDDGLPSPVFLIGFPRSGTTMLEQVLDAHPDIVTSNESPLLGSVPVEIAQLGSGGDLETQLANLDSNRIRARRRAYWDAAKHFTKQPVESCVFIDKLPLNILKVGLINLLFPQARLIVALRDPRDVCLSCFMQLFQLNQAMSNFLTLEGTVAFYAEVMRFWLAMRSRITLPSVEMRYENTVNDLEGESRRILDWLGLPWNDAVLSFHEHAQRKRISTPSYEAVTQAVTKRAVARWRNYEAHVAKPFENLKPLIEALGY